MTPTEAITALEKALEAGPTPGEWFANDWSQDSGPCPNVIESRTPEVLGLGQSSIWPGGLQKHQIATTESSSFGADMELANAAFIAAANPLAIRTILDAHAGALRDAAELRKVLDTSRSALIANHKWHQDYDDHGGYEGSDLESTNLAAIYGIESVESVNAALATNTKGAAPELADLGINGSRCGTHGTSGS